MFTVEQIKSLNELEMAVYQYVMQHQTAVSYMRIRELAAEAHVSTTTVLRFCKKLGCDGYAEFKLRMKEYAGQQGGITVPEDLYELKAFLERAESDSIQQRLDQAAAMIAKADRVLCVGICNSGYVAQYAARYFTSFGKFCLSVTDPYYPMKQFDSSLTTVGIVFSVSGEAERAVHFAKDLKQHHCSIVSITNTEQSTVAQLSDVCIPYYITLRRKQEHPDRSEEAIDFSSQVPAVVLAETLAKRVASRLTED